MSNGGDRANSPNPDLKTAATDLQRRVVVCLISANPLALTELRRMVVRIRMTVKLAHLDLNSIVDVHDAPVPNASVYVLDAYSTGAVTEAVVAGIRARRASARLIVLADRFTEAMGFSFLQLGVKGLIRHKEAAQQLSAAIVAVSKGGVWIPRALMSQFLEGILGNRHHRGPTPSTRQLSQRERQVLDCVLRSLSNKEISTSLNISESTVKFHLARLFNKFGVRRRSDLILQSIQQPAVLVH